MPVAPKRPCRQPGCPVLTTTGACPAHQPREADRPNAVVRRWYRTAHWRRLRRLVLAEQPLCGDCDAHGHVTLATEVHHQAKHHGDPALFYLRSNLTGLCASCHSQRTARGE